MSGIVIRTIKGEFTGELGDNAISDTVWLSLPKTYSDCVYCFC